MSFKRLFSRSLSRRPRSAAFRRAQPSSVARRQLRWAHAGWNDAARLADRKWDKVMDEVWPEAQARGRAPSSAPASPTPSSFRPTPMISSSALFAAAAARRAAPLRVLTSDGEFHSARRQFARWAEDGWLALETRPAEPSTAFSIASSPRRERRPRPHLRQPGAVRQRADFRRGRGACRARPARRTVGRDRRLSRLHGARPALRRSRGADSFLPRRRLQICDGGRRLRLHACAPGLRPAAPGHRLVRRVRGSEPAARAASAMPRMRGASSARPSTRRRSTASPRSSGCWRRRG